MNSGDRSTDNYTCPIDEKEESKLNSNNSNSTDPSCLNKSNAPGENMTQNQATEKSTTIDDSNRNTPDSTTQNNKDSTAQTDPNPIDINAQKYIESSEEAYKFLIENQENQDLEVYSLAYDGKFEEIEKLAEMEWLLADAASSDYLKYVIKGRKSWPIIFNCEKYLVAKKASGKTVLCKVGIDNKIYINKNSNYKRIVKPNSIGKTPIGYAILGDLKSKRNDKTTFYLLFCCAIEYDSIENIFHLIDSIQIELNNPYLFQYANFPIKKTILQSIINKDNINQLITISKGLPNHIINYVNIDKKFMKSLLALSINSNARQCTKFLIENTFEALKNMETLIYSKYFKIEIDKQGGIDLKSSKEYLLDENTIQDAEYKRKLKAYKIIIDVCLGFTTNFQAYLNSIETYCEFYLSIVDNFIKLDKSLFKEFWEEKYQVYFTEPGVASLIAANDFSNLLNFLFENTDLTFLPKYNENLQYKIDSFKFITKNENFDIFPNYKSLLSTAIEKNSKKCMNILFNRMINIISSSIKNNSININFIQMIENEFQNYLDSPPEIFQNIFSYILEEKPIKFNDSEQSLPIYNMIRDEAKVDHSNNYYFCLEENMNAKLFKSIIKLPVIPGSIKSIKLLKHLEELEFYEIYKTLSIKYYILYKWKNIWKFILLQNILILSYNFTLFMMIDIDNEIKHINDFKLSKYLILLIFLSFSEIIQLIGVKNSFYPKSIDLLNSIFVPLTSITICISAVMEVIGMNILYTSLFAFILHLSLTICLINMIKPKNYNREFCIANHNHGMFLILFIVKSIENWLGILSVVFISISYLINIWESRSYFTHHKHKLNSSLSKMILCIVLLLIKVDPYHHLLFFQIYNILQLIASILSTKNIKVNFDFFLIDMSLIVAVAFNMIYPEYFFIRIIITAICLISCLNNFHYLKINDLSCAENQAFFRDMIHVLYWMKVADKALLQSVIVLLFGIVQFIFLNNNRIIDLQKSFNSLKSFIGFKCIHFVRPLIFILWITCLIYFQENHKLLLYILIVLSCCQSLTVFYSFKITRYIICLVINSLKQIYLFIFFLLYSLLYFGIISSVTRNDIENINSWIFLYFNFSEGTSNKTQLFDVNILLVAVIFINTVNFVKLLISEVKYSLSGFHYSYQAIEIKEMISVLLRIESLMFWKRKTEDKGASLVVIEPRLKKEDKSAVLVKFIKKSDEITIEGEFPEDKIDI